MKGREDNVREGDREGLRVDGGLPSLESTGRG